MKRTVVRAVAVVLAVVGVGVLVWHTCFRGREVGVREGEPYAEVELRLQRVALAKRAARPGEWLFAHAEPGQTFNEYVQAGPTRRTKERHTIYLCLVGEFTAEQEKVLAITREYLSVFFDAPVQVRGRLALRDIPESAQRRSPSEGQLQLLTHWFLYDRLKADCPEDALAYVAFTATDLWTRDGTRDWNFVFGQADISNRLGVWSLARFGDPAASEEAFRRCLKLTLGTATHETGHILGMYHCVIHECNMNGSNHLDEAFRTPTTLCPVCLRKLCWNLQVEPVAYLKKLQVFCEDHGMKEHAKLYQRSIELLGGRVLR